MYRTGDLGLLRSDGELIYLGRVDQQVKLRGFRIELAEIESVLTLHPRVKQSFVTVRSDEGEPQLVAYLVPEGTAAAPTVGELLAYLRERLPDYMVPSALVTLAALPLTLNGKVDLALLPAPDRRAAGPRQRLQRAAQRAGANDHRRLAGGAEGRDRRRRRQLLRPRRPLAAHGQGTRAAQGGAGAGHLADRALPVPDRLVARPPSVWRGRLGGRGADGRGDGLPPHPAFGGGPERRCRRHCHRRHGRAVSPARRTSRSCGATSPAGARASPSSPPRSCWRRASIRRWSRTPTTCGPRASWATSTSSTPPSSASIRARSSSWTRSTGSSSNAPGRRSRTPAGMPTASPVSSGCTPA